MAKQPKRKILTTILSILGLIVFLLAIAGATYGRSFWHLIGRDKDFIRRELLAVHEDRKGSPELAKLGHELEAKLGKFKSILNIMGHADIGDVTSGKQEYSYYAYCDFEKGEGTYFIRLENATETPKLVSATADLGHKKRRRVRQEILSQLR